CARESTDDCLTDAHDEETASEHRINDAEEVRVQRSLIEHISAQPVTRGDLSSPLVVAAAIAHQHGEEWGLAHLPEVGKTHDEGDDKDDRGLFPSHVVGQCMLARFQNSAAG